MASVNVCQNTTAILISIAAQNVCSVLIVIRIKRAFEENVLILASGHVAKTLFVKLLTTSLCAVAFKDFPEMHLLHATQLKVNPVIYLMFAFTVVSTIYSITYFILQRQYMRILVTQRYVGPTVNVEW